MSAASPLVSVVIPSYNSARTLALCLGAVAAQTYAPIETIVVDDGSTDCSARVAESAGVTVLRTGTNSGQSVARNLGAAAARGEILFFLDADVALDAGSVAAAVDALRADPTVGAVSGVLDPEPLLATSRAARYRALQMHHFWIKHETPTAGPHMALFAIRADVFAETGPFNPRLRHTEPQEYGGRLRQRYATRVCRAIHGRHDHQTTLRELLPKVFRRARASIVEYRPGGELGGTPARAVASGLVLGALLTLPLPLLAGPIGAAVPLLLLAASVALDADTYREVFADHGAPFGGYFLLAHVAFQTAAATGAAAGVLQRVLTRPAPAR